MSFWPIIAALLGAFYAFVDYRFSTKRIRKFGIEIELNPVAKYLVDRLGIKKGVILTVFPPAAIFIIGLLAIGWIGWLYFYIGFKSAWFLGQMATIQLEKELLNKKD